MTKPAGLILIACLPAAPLPAGAQEATVIESLIAAESPCAALGTEIAGVAIGIDRLEAVTLRTATATLEGDDASLSFAGRLACSTPEGAAVQGDAAASVTADAELSLADCDTASVTVRLHEFGGTLGAALEVLSPAIEQEIAEAARPRLVDACRRFAAAGDHALPEDAGGGRSGQPAQDGARPQAATANPSSTPSPR